MGPVMMIHRRIKLTVCSRSLVSAIALAITATVSLAQEVVPRTDALVLETTPAGTIFNNYNNLNPYAVGNDLRTHVAFIYEPLFYWSALSDELIPMLATSYQFNEDFTEVVVSLREGAEWSDGVPFSADDVVYTFEMLRKNGSEAKDLLRAVEVSTAVERTEKVDDHTVRFYLTTTDPRFVMRMLAAKFTTGLYPLPKHIWEKQEDVASFLNLDQSQGFPVGTGPYQLVVNYPDRIIMDRRDDWWGLKDGVWGEQEGEFYTDMPEVKRIIAIPQKDPQQSSQLVALSQTDWAVNTPVPIVKQILKTNDNLTTFTGDDEPYGNVDWFPSSLFFNQDSEAVKDINVRKAILYTLNTKQIIDVFFEGAADPLYQPYPEYPVLQPYIDAIEPVSRELGYQIHDQERADSFMREAGYEKDSSGFWAKDGRRWTAAMDSATNMEPIGAIIAEQLRRGGFQIDWASRPDSRPRIFSGRSDLQLWGHPGSAYDPHDTMLFYHSRLYKPVGESSPNFHRWRNERFDELTDQVGALPVNDPAIIPLVKEAFTIWAEDVVEVPIAQAYHRIPMSTTYWTNWPSVDHPYAPPTTLAYTSPLVIHGLTKANRD
jgi:peptide/nickel transport system substrate-binding protein